MDAFSWFRQKRQGLRPMPLQEVHIPLDPIPTAGFVVYFRADEGALPGPEDLLGIAREWLRHHAGEMLQEAIEGFLDQGLLSLLIEEKSSVPHPPDDMLLAYNPGENEERRYRNSTHVVFIGAPDLLLPPRVGLWAVTAVARALTAGLRGGVLLDPEFPRLVTQEVGKEDLPSHGHLRLPDHILIPYSQDPRSGLLWITTKGMARFGLPDLELRNVPPNLVQSLMPVMNGMAQRLADAATRAVIEGHDREPPTVLVLPSEIPFGLADIRRAYERSDGIGEEEFTTEGDPPGKTTFRLEVTGSEEEETCFVRLLPPRGTKTSTGVWLNSLLTDLLGMTDEMAFVETEDEAMEAAHQEATASIPLVRNRFSAGFRSGEVLHVKHGFPIHQGGHEYMWIAVTAWTDEGRIKGYLSSDPQYRHDLKAGQKVEIGQDEVYDWLIRHSDGRMEGAFTNRILHQRDE